MSLALGAANYEQGESTTTFQSLRASIRTHGGVIHPILVNKENENRLVVIEGNARALIYRQLSTTCGCAVSNDSEGNCRSRRSWPTSSECPPSSGTSAFMRLERYSSPSNALAGSVDGDCDCPPLPASFTVLTG